MYPSQLSISVLLATLALPLLSGIAHTAPGDADPAFGGAGYVRYAAPKVVPGLFGSALGLDDGSAIVAGGADPGVFVRRYRPDGTFDAGFGTNGTTIVPGLSGNGDSGRTTPLLHLFRDPLGGILLEQAGKVRRLTTAGLYDSTYSPAVMNVQGRSGFYSFMPQQDGRYVVVAGQQSSMETFKISVRFFLRDGTPDNTRGDANGERLLYPGGTGQYTDSALSAVTDAGGKILIGARWQRTQLDVQLVLIRLNADGNYDSSFGTGGVVTVGTQLGGVSSPQVTVDRDGRIGYFFYVDSFNGSPPDPYFVVYVFRPDGQQDASAPAAGRISVVIPSGGAIVSTLRWVSGSPELMIAGSTKSNALVLGNPGPPIRLMVWRANLASGTVGVPEYSGAGLGSDFFLNGLALAGNGWLWAFGGEDNYIYGRVGVASLTGIGRGVLLAFDTKTFPTTNPTRIVSTFSGRYLEAFGGAKLLSNGSVLVLGTYNFERQQFPVATLTRFTANGQIDSGYANGSGRIAFGTGDGAFNRLVPSSDDRATVLKSGNVCGIRSCIYRASLWRFSADGTVDPAFGASGVMVTSSDEQFGTLIAPGFVDQQGAVTLVRLADNTIRPLRYTAGGTTDATFAGATQSAASASSLPKQVKLDVLPDGRLQAVVVAGGAQQLTVNVYRWLQGGAVDSASAQIAGVTIAAVDLSSYANAIDTLALADGRTLVTIDQASQRIVLRLRPDGSLDTGFGNGGTVRIDGVARQSAARLALESGGKLLLAYNTALGNGVALTVARFSADGQRDLTFTADGRFDSLFSLSGNETAADLLVLPDGHLLAVGQSDGYGLLLKLRGTSIQTVQQSAPVVEFFNTMLGHYFVSGGPGEIVIIDTGGAGPGWQRTGLGFRAYLPETGIAAGASPVCRFYGTPGRGPNSHFYTVNASECAAVKRDPGWTYEGTAFHLFAPVNAQCANGQQAVYRAYNNRFAQNDSNHRYTTDPGAYAQMQAQGWLPEGVVFCGPLQ